MPKEKDMPNRVKIVKLRREVDNGLKFGIKTGYEWLELACFHLGSTCDGISDDSDTIRLLLIRKLQGCLNAGWRSIGGNLHIQINRAVSIFAAVPFFVGS